MIENKSQEAPVGGVKSEWLEAFIAVYEAGSYSGGGRKMGRPQSDASRYVQKLEDWLGKTLLTTEVDLTPDGVEFLPKAAEICRLLRVSRAVAEQLAPAPKVVRVAPPPPAPVTEVSRPKSNLSAAHIDMSFYTKRKEG